MRKMEETQMDLKREKIIRKLVEDGVLKIHGKHLYELPLYALMKPTYYVQNNTVSA